MTTGVTLTRPGVSTAFFTGEQGNPLHHHRGLSFSPASRQQAEIFLLFWIIKLATLAGRLAAVHSLSALLIESKLICPLDSGAAAQLRMPRPMTFK